VRYAAMELERIQDFNQRKELRPLDRLKQYFAALVDRQGQNSSRPGCLLAYLSLEVSDKSSQLSRSARTSAIGRSGYGLGRIAAPEADEYDLRHQEGLTIGEAT